MPPPGSRAVSHRARRRGIAAEGGSDGMRNGTAQLASSDQRQRTAAAAEGRAGGRDEPQIQALEAMVAELLRPMLRRWLDENMPRLVSAALKEEAERMSERDAKKP